MTFAFAAPTIHFAFSVSWSDGGTQPLDATRVPEARSKPKPGESGRQYRPSQAISMNEISTLLDGMTC